MIKNTCLAIFKLFILLSFATSSVKGSPVYVDVGLYLLDIYNIDIQKESFSADFYLWLSWVNPLKTSDFDPSALEVMNGEFTQVSKEATQKDGRNWVSMRYTGVFRTKYNFKEYPLDKQRLSIYFESSRYDSEELVFVVSPQRRQPEYRISCSGWEMDGTPITQVNDFNYHSTFGNPRRSESESAVYSRLAIIFPLQHTASYWTYLKLFLPVYISVAIAFLTFLINPTDMDPRFGVGVAAIFGGVSSLIVANTTIPETPYFSLSDKIHLVSLGFIFMTILSSCILLKICRECNLEKIKRFDLYGGGGLLVLYAIIMAAITVSALI